MNLLKVLQLPAWSLTNKYPAFCDFESMTSLEQTTRLYGKMKELIDSYNLWVEEVNKAILEYKEEEDRQDACFEEKILKITNDFIASVEDKMAFQNAEFLEIRGLISDLNANIKTEVESATRSIIETMKESGEFNDIILSTLDEVNERLSVYENEITQKFNDLQAQVQEELDSLSNVAGDLANLKERAETLEGDNEKNKRDILTNQTNIYNLDGRVDKLVDDYNQLFDLMFPVGYTFIDTKGDIDYSNHLGLSWQKTLQGVSPVGQNASDTDFANVGKTGGEKTHALNESELPNIRGAFRFASNVVTNIPSAPFTYSSGIIDNNHITTTTNISTKVYVSNPVVQDNVEHTNQVNIEFGNNVPHNNMQPYQVVAFWTRIA